jgi:hypothetical protein
MERSLAISFLARDTVNTPRLYSALTLSGSTVSGKLKQRAKAPKLRPGASPSLAGSRLRPDPHSAPPPALPATSGSTSGPTDPPPGRARTLAVENAESNRNSLSGPRRTPLDTRLANARVSPPTPGAPSAPLETHRTIQEVRFKDRLQDQQGRHLQHPVAHRPYSQRSQLPIRLRDVDVLHRLRPVGFRVQRFLNPFQKSRRALVRPHALFDRDAVHPGRSLVPVHPLPSRFQHIPPIDPVIQHIERELRFLLGLLACFCLS